MAMEYKEFIVRAFEREPGKWRASVERADGKAIMAMTNRRTLAKFVTISGHLGAAHNGPLKLRV
jgi:hypothetical protein